MEVQEEQEMMRKDFDFDTEYSKNTERLKKIRLQEILKNVSMKGVAYKYRQKSKI